MARSLVVLLSLCCLAFPIRAQSGAKDGQWRHYAGDSGATKYAPLDLIDKDNARKLRIAWRWPSPDVEVRKKNLLKLADLIPFVHEPTPLMVNGVLYTSTGLTSEHLKMFAANIAAVGEPQRSEGIDSIKVIANSDIDQRVIDGTICDGPTISLIAHARARGLL